MPGENSKPILALARFSVMAHNHAVDTGYFVQHLNWVDWAVLLILLAYVAMGVRRGFVMGALDLIGMGISLGAAMLGYRALSGLVLQVLQLPRAVAILGSFLALVFVAQILYSILVNLLFRFGRPLFRLFGPLAMVDSGLGVIPGTAKGLIFTTLVLLPFALFPLVPQVSASVESSALGSKLVVAAVDAAPALESLMGRELNEGLSFLTPPQTEEGMAITFGPLGQLSEDEDSEQKMLQMLNAERSKAGLRPLKFDGQLRQVAAEHSNEMFKLGYFGHTSPVSGSPFDRMRAAGIGFAVAGENLAYAPNVDIAHEGLMNSPGHRANILRPEFGRVGIAVIKSEFRGRMFTQEFAN